MNAPKIFKNVDEVIQLFKDEFEPIHKKFEIIKVLDGHKLDYNYIINAQKPSQDYNIIWHPGVYVFFGNQSVYRIGRSLDNSRKRALGHITENTNKDDHQIFDLVKFSDTELILFNVINKNDMHWVAAVEIYLEKVLEPLIKSGRTG